MYFTAWSPVVSPPVSPLHPPLSLTPRSSPSPPSLALQSARLPGCTGTHWFRPPCRTAANCSLYIRTSMTPTWATNTPPSSFLCLHLSSSPISLCGGSLHLSVSSLLTPWPPSAPLFVQIQIFLHWNSNFVSLFSLFCPKNICFLKRAGLSRLLIAERGQEVI